MSSCSRAYILPERPSAGKLYRVLVSREVEGQNSCKSGAAILGKKKGDDVVVESPGGSFKYNIRDISIPQ